MKRLALLLLLLALGCSNSLTSPVQDTPSATLKRASSSCEIVSAYRGDGYETQVGPIWHWHIQGSFRASCGDAMRVTLFFVNIDESREMFGSGWVSYDAYGLTHFEIEGKAPSFNWDDVMTDEHHDHWFPVFEAEVTRGGQLIGRYKFNTVVQLPPNIPHGRAAHGVNR